MILKLFAAAALVAAPVPASQQMKLAPFNYPGVYRVDCWEGSGTAFRVGKRHFYSVAHVTAMHGCSIEGHPITLTEQNVGKDFSQFDADFAGPILKVSCEGYHAGEYVWSTGFALGLPYQTAIALYPTYAKDGDGKRVLIGPYAVIPGMSGGPVFNRDGEVIGEVNAYIKDSDKDGGLGISFSRDLRDTSVCASSHLG